VRKSLVRERWATDGIRAMGFQAMRKTWERARQKKRGRLLECHESAIGARLERQIFLIN
jgi:hypothetical protein